MNGIIKENIDAESQFDDDKKLAIKVSRFYTDNAPSSALAISSLLGEAADISTLIKQVDELSSDVIDGNNRKVQGMLITQSKTLQVIFNHMASKAVETKTMEGLKIYMDIALKAQNQCRNTLLALNEIQNPPQQQTIVRQQNVAINQQVNNQTEMLDNKTEVIDFTNELISEGNHASLDIGRTLKAGTVDQKAKAVVKVDRSHNTSRKGD